MKKNPYSLSPVLWIIFYCYSTFAAIMFQKVILPLFPRYHGGNGLLTGTDSVFFHQIAVKLAAAIRANGWAQWTLRPAEGATGNVSLLAALYAIFGVDPIVIVPVNAAIHATSGLLLFLIARELWPGKIGTYSGIMAASLFILFPSALNWYGQIHKDGFAILGMLIIFSSWLKGFHCSSKLRGGSWLIFGTIVGSALVIFVRPYNIKLLMISAIILFCAVLIYFVVKKRAKTALFGAGILLVLIIFLSAVNSYMPGLFIIEKKEMVMEAFKEQGIDWTWRKSEKVPAIIDKVLENTTLVRIMNIYHSKLVSAGSVIDADVKPESAWSTIAYLPRAAFIALFAPFPDRWFSRAGIVNLVSVGETMFWYFCVPGLIMAFWYRRSLEMALMALNALIFMTILGFTNPIVGTLYRFRYVYLFIFIMMGIMGWMEFARRNFRKIIPCTFVLKRGVSVPGLNPNSSAGTIDPIDTKTMVMTAGFTVIAFTLFSNILLVARDIVLARWFGLGSELDAFFIAMIVPMFLVSVISIPIGTVVIPPLISLFQKGSKEDSQRFITMCSTVIFCVMLFFTLVLYISGKIYLPVIGWGFSAEKIMVSHRILMIILPILFFSGLIILGNSILNARQKFALPAAAQAAVPIVAILALVIAAKYIGIYAMAVGMVVGQIINLLIVSYYVNKEGYSFFPRVSFLIRSHEYASNLLIKSRGLWSQYVPLVLAALFVSLALPVNNMMAASLVSGSVSAFNLGFKFIMFFTGLVGTGIATVMLPHFSHYFAMDRLADVRKELSFFVIITMLVSLPLTVLVSMLSPLIVKMVFYGGLFTAKDVNTVTKIMEYGLLQMPYFCVGMIMTKYANARRKNAIIAICSLSGLAVNVLLDFVFMRTMGISGIALASSLSIICSTGLLILVGYSLADITYDDLVFFVLTTMVYLIFFLYNYYFNLLGIITTAIIFFMSLMLRFIPFQYRIERSPAEC
jgi:putative peptidoglycan lipid II flippase